MEKNQVPDNSSLWEKIVQVAVAMESAFTEEEIFQATTRELRNLATSATQALSLGSPRTASTCASST